MVMDLIIWLCVIIYFVALIHLICFTLPSIRKRHKSFKPYPPRKEGENFYEKNLQFFVLFRQILLFFLPLALGAIVLGDNVSSQFSSLFVLGLSLNVFWVVQLPLLAKANLHITFASKPLDENSINDNSPNEEYRDWLEIDPSKENCVACAIYNLGFHTYKNALVLLYFGKEIEIIPCNDDKLKDRLDKLDFNKKYRVQKRHGGAAFNPKDNYLTIPPKEVFIFPIFVRVKETPIREKVTIEFSSETSWGKTVTEIPMKLKK